MTFKDEVDAAGERHWKRAYEDGVTNVLDACVEKIDELERDLYNVRAATVHTDERMDKLIEFVSRLEVKLFKLSVSANQPPVEIPNIPEEVLRDAIEIFKATVAEKKWELDHSPKMEK